MTDTKRLRELVDMPVLYNHEPGELRSLILAACEELDRLRASEFEDQCDECRGVGEYLIDGEPQLCICVGETAGFQRVDAALRAENKKLRAALVGCVGALGYIGTVDAGTSQALRDARRAADAAREAMK